MKMNNNTLLFSIVTLLFCLNTVHAEPIKTLNWVGCGISKKAFMAELAEAYFDKTNIKINMEGGGATKGIRDVAAIAADMGGSCRHTVYGATEEAGVHMIPMAWDALVVITHPDNPVTGVSLKQLKAIYKGKITNWSALGGPDQKIDLYVRKGKESGVGLTLREMLFKKPDADFVAAKEFKSSGPVEKSVETDKWSIAVTGISSAKRRNVNMITFADRHGE